jgi:hypothetical protein
LSPKKRSNLTTLIIELISSFNSNFVSAWKLLVSRCRDTSSQVKQDSRMLLWCEFHRLSGSFLTLSSQRETSFEWKQTIDKKAWNWTEKNIERKTCNDHDLNMSDCVLLCCRCNYICPYLIWIANRFLASNRVSLYRKLKRIHLIVWTVKHNQN